MLTWGVMSAYLNHYCTEDCTVSISWPELDLSDAEVFFLDRIRSLEKAIALMAELIGITKIIFHAITGGGILYPNKGIKNIMDEGIQQHMLETITIII